MALTSFGASVAGPGHLRDQLPNQDAWGHASVSGGRVVVVADGMGSKPQADMGSAAACAAVPEALRIWTRHKHAPQQTLLGLIHLIWRARLGALPPEEAATTCIFAYMREDGSGLLGQLGDGQALVLEGKEVRAIHQRDADEFTNQTHALGSTRKLGAWHLETLPPGDRSIILCTDGVADDLLESRYRDFATWVKDELLPLPPGIRWRRVAKELRAWPTPNHIDDKTLAVLQRQP